MADKIPMTALGQNQNLINPIRIEKIESLGRPPGFYKSIVLDVFGILAAFLTGYAYFKFLGGVWPLVAPFGAFLLLVIVFTLETLLEHNVWRRMTMLIAEVVALFVPFYGFSWRILGIAAAVAFFFFLAGYLRGRGELSHGNTIRFFRSTHGTVAKAVTAALLVAIILYLPLVGTGSVFVGESTFAIFFNWTAGLVGNFYPTISFTGSFADFAQSVAKEVLAENTTFKAMSPSDQAAAISAATVQVEVNLSKSLGVTPSANSSVSDIAYNAIKGTLEGWRDRFAVWFTVVWAVALFLVLRSVGVIVVWIGQFLAMIAYELLLSAGMIRIVEEPQTKEVLTY